MRAHNDDDAVYYRERERHCRQMAQSASDPAVQQIHHQFAEAYARRLRAGSSIASPFEG